MFKKNTKYLHIIYGLLQHTITLKLVENPLSGICDTICWRIF